MLIHEKQEYGSVTQLNIGVIQYAAKDFRSNGVSAWNPKRNGVTYCPHLNHYSVVELKDTEKHQNDPLE